MTLRGYIGTMAGRLFVFLLLGVITSATLALAFADVQRQADLNRIRADRVIDRMSDFLSVADHAQEPLRSELLANGVNGIRPANGKEVIQWVDTELTNGLEARMGRTITAAQATATSCVIAESAPPIFNPFECWLVTATLSDGTLIKLQVRGRLQEESSTLNPLFIVILAPGIAALAFLAARMAAAPLGQLSRAAQALGTDLDRPPLKEHGPQEVREAARAFNKMQAELRNYLVERTQLLASITHDLQTPMTRLRLRLENIDDAALRSRLIDDVGTMQELIQEWLNYARRAQITEPFASFALDELLEVIVDDAAASTNKPVTFIRRCCCDVEARPRALQRCLSNLADNALKYGNSAEVSAALQDGVVQVRIPAHKLASVFDPFVRLERSSDTGTDGVGLGLTIAKMLAESNEAVLTLRNHEHGGLEAKLIISKGVTKIPNSFAPISLADTSTSY
jgi:signal transduction histidine kinase